MTSETTVVKIENSFGYEGDERLFEYDKELMFPITRWLQMHRGERITHRLYAEFTMLTTKVASNLLSKYDYSDEAHAAQTEMLYRLDNCMLHLWDVRAELRPWLVRKMSEGIIGTRILSDLPSASIDAFRRETKYRGGPSDLEMALGNLEHVIMHESSENVPFTDEDMERARETSQGDMDYDIDLEPYL